MHLKPPPSNAEKVRERGRSRPNLCFLMASIIVFIHWCIKQVNKVDVVSSVNSVYSVFSGNAYNFKQNWFRKNEVPENNEGSYEIKRTLTFA